jgi:hypothetical protein
MPNECPPGHRSDADLVNAIQKYCDFTIEDINSEWMDLMVKRLLLELNRQMCQVENQKAQTSQPGDRMENARVLASLQGSMAKLTRLEAERETRRKGKNVTKNADARKALERKLDKLAAAARKKKPR